MSRTRPVLVAAIVASVLGGVLCGGAYGQAPKPTDSKIGVVDVGRVNEDYIEVKTGRAQLDALTASLSDILKMRQKYSLLSPQELDELEKLTGTRAPSDQDKQRIQDLTKKGDDAAAELETLRNKKDPTDADKARLKELTDIGAKSSADIEARRAEFANTVQTKEQDLLSKLQDKMDAAIGELAQQKGLWIVVDQEAVHWGGLDLTDELIAKLNKDAQPK